MALTTQVRDTFAGTPGQMRAYGLFAVVGCLAFGILSGVAAASSAGAVDRAGDDAAQLVRVQRIASDLLAADASASTSYLQAGQSGDQHLDFDNALRDADLLIAEAASAQPADAEALGRLNVEVSRYSSLIEHARADNRQGLVVGQQYQRLASQGLRERALPIVDAIVTANRARLGASDGAGETGWPTRQALLQAAAMLLGLAILIGVSRWLAQATRRRYNVLLLLATGLVLVGGLVGLCAQLLTIARLDNFDSGPMAAAQRAAENRRLLYDARAIEGLQLIGRGNGDYERLWRSATDKIQVPSQGRESLRRYQQRHAEARALDDGSGNWAAAVALTSNSERSGFAALDKVVTAQAATSASAVSAALQSNSMLIVLQWALPTLGLLAGLAAVQGMEQRIAEYR